LKKVERKVEQGDRLGRVPVHSVRTPNLHVKPWEVCMWFAFSMVEATERRNFDIDMFEATERRNSDVDMLEATERRNFCVNMVEATERPKFEVSIGRAA
jgi:hypothetical protein